MISTDRCDAEVAAVSQQLGTRLAGNVLHHDEVLVAGFIEPEVEHLHDVRMHEPRGSERLSTEARDERRVIGEVLSEELDGDIALEALVESQMDGRHAADPEPALDPITPGDRRRAHHAA